MQRLDNPFLYGHPVKADKFVGREDLIDILIQRVRTDQDSSIVGGLKLGKSSVFNALATLENLLRMRKPGNSNEKVELILIDMVLFESHDTAESFWKNVSRQMLNKVTDANAREVIQDFIKEADFTALSIGALFGDLALADYRFVFFLDNFDHILDLKDLLASNFLGSLRSHSGASDYYRLIVSVQGRLSELSNATKKLNPHASSFVNAYPIQSIEVFT